MVAQVVVLAPFLSSDKGPFLPALFCVKFKEKEIMRGMGGGVVVKTKVACLILRIGT
jgi:hypothetical protein